MDDMQPELTIEVNGNKFWWLHGRYHRTDGPALEYVNGDKEWWAKGLRHRTDGPAIEYANGLREWWVFNECHRTDGPAVEHGPNHAKEWYLHNVPYTFDEWLDRTPGLTEEEKVMFKLQHA
jgi:hypothetical protein